MIKLINWLINDKWLNKTIIYIITPKIQYIIALDKSCRLLY